jgi:hypothetical protein
MVFDYIIVSKIKDKDLTFFSIFLELWLLSAYPQSAPRFFNYLLGLNRVNFQPCEMASYSILSRKRTKCNENV